MKGQLKANTVDRYLKPIRNQIIDLVEPRTDVIELGCGNGDLLFRLSHKINFGIGLDNSESLISFANKRKTLEGKNNITFKLNDLEKEFPSDKTFDYSIASLLFHVIPWSTSIDLITEMVKISETTIICGFSEPKNWRQNFLLWMDQRFSGHYSCYKNYSKKHNMEGLLKEIHGINYHCFETFDPVIKIYKISK